MGVESAAAGVSTTLALEIAAPEGSFTCPCKLPDAGWTTGVWETATVAHNCNNKKKEKKNKYFRNFIKYSIP
jgi:hypothetical protein